MELIEILHSSSALVEYSDPHVPVMPKLRKHDFDMSSVELNKESLSQFDAALLVTDHDRFDYDLIREHSNLVVDTRGRYARSSHDNIVNA
jgi:UDP-N-acetyl-D-glucosamine dehydrogenase